MQTDRLVERLGLENGPGAWRGWFRDQIFLTNWLRYDGEDNGLAVFTSVSVIDPAVLGMGGSTVTSSAELRLARDGRPVSYVSRAQGKTLRINFDGDPPRAVLPDGSSHQLEMTAPVAVLENNHPGEMALLLAGIEGPLDAAAPAVFLASALNEVPYALSRENGEFVSEFGERLTLDAVGALSELTTQDGALRIVRLDPAPNMPQGSDEAAPERAYTPSANARFTLADTTIAGAEGMLGATFAEPETPPWGGVLMLQGSGEVDRHGFAGGIDTGTHAFADALAEAGLLVLRYDKQGVGLSPRTDDTLGRGYGEAVADAACCLDALRQRLGNVGPVIVVGHSLGGLTALVLSVEQNDGALPLVLLAAPGRPLDQLVVEQIEGQGQRLDLSEVAIKRQIGDFEAFMAHARGEREEATLGASVRAGRHMARFYSEIGSYDPVSLISRQTAPVLICQGATDLQVSADRDARRLQKVARTAGVSAELYVFDGLNHLFRPDDGNRGLAAYHDNTQVSPDAVAAVVAWCGGLRARSR